MSQVHVEELETLYREYSRQVRWVLRARGVSESALDDCAHDVFVAAYRRLPERDRTIPSGVWLAGVARNVAFSHRRSLAREHQRIQQLQVVPDSPTRFEEHVAARETWSHLVDLLGDLPREQREVFVMVDVLEMQVTELEHVLEAPLNTLYSRLRLARRRLRERLAAGDDEAQLRSLVQGAQREETDSPVRSFGVVLVGLELGRSSTAPPTASIGFGKLLASATLVGAVVAGVGVATHPGSNEPGSVPARRAVTRERVAASIADANRGPEPSLAASTGDSGPTVRPEAVEPEVVGARVEPRSGQVGPQAAERAKQPQERALRTGTTRRSNAPDSQSDESLAAQLRVVEIAQHRLREDDPTGALHWIEHNRTKVTTLAPELRRIERLAACRAQAGARAKRIAQAMGDDGRACPSPRRKNGPRE